MWDSMGAEYMRDSMGVEYMRDSMGGALSNRQHLPALYPKAVLPRAIVPSKHYTSYIGSLPMLSSMRIANLLLSLSLCLESLELSLK